MSPLPLLALLTLTAAPERWSFVMRVGGVPVSLVTLAREGLTYTWVQTRVFRDREAVQHSSGPWRDDAPPEVWWLSQRRAAGCRTVTEEARGVPEEVCVEPRGGTIAGVRFTAAWAATGGLEWLELPDGVRFEAGDVPLEAADLFHAGFAVTGAGPRLTLAPALPGAQVLARAPTPSGRDTPGACLDEARAAVARDAGLTLVLGVVVEAGRAFPHAWVRRGEVHEDPSLLAPAPGRQYLALPPAQAGQVYLELLAGRRAVVRGR
jgi:hypothetical protein